MKCPKCGADNPDHVAFCGKCGQDLPLRAHTWKEETVSRVQQETAERDETTQLQAQISTAINTRRIALVLVLLVFLTIISTLFGLWVSIFEPEARTAEAMATIWLIIALLVMIGGLYFIVRNKRLTQLSPDVTTKEKKGI